MPFIPTNVPVLKFRLMGVSATENVDNLFYWSYGGSPPAAADCVSFANDISAAFKAAFQIFLSPSYSFVNCECIDITTATGNSGVSTISGWAGTSAGNHQVNSSCAVISWPIARRYRGGKARTYLGPITDNLLTDPRSFTVPGATAIATAADTMVGSLIGDTRGSTSLAQSGTVSRFLDKVERNPFVFEPFVLPPNMDTRVGSQRRRMGKLETTREPG